PRVVKKRLCRKFVCGRGYLRAVDGSSFCTLADGVVGQMIYCTNNGRFLKALWQWWDGRRPSLCPQWQANHRQKRTDPRQAVRRGGAGEATPPRAALALAVYDVGASLLGMRRV